LEDEIIGNLIEAVELALVLGGEDGPFGALLGLVLATEFSEGEVVGEVDHLRLHGELAELFSGSGFLLLEGLKIVEEGLEFGGGDAIGVVLQGVLQNIEIDFVIEGTHGLFSSGDDVATPVEGVGIGTMLCPHFACLVCIF
jgi:hypothetical protein